MGGIIEFDFPPHRKTRDSDGAALFESLKLKIETFVIHLSRSAERSAQVAVLLRAAPTSAQVLDAVDGRELTADEKAGVYRAKLYRPHYPFEFRDSEIACFLSHRRAWQAIVDSDLDAGLVLEDDVVLDGDIFPQAFDLAVANMGDGEFVRFPQKLRETPRKIISENNVSKLYIAKAAGAGMLGQLVTRGAALCLLERSICFDRPVDGLLQMPWVVGDVLRSVWPSGLSERSGELGGSTISQKKSLKEVFRREVSRPLYRLRFKAYAWRFARRRHNF